MTQTVSRASEGDFDDEEIEEVLVYPIPKDSEEDDEETELFYPLLPPDQVYEALSAELEDADAAAIRLNPYNPR